MDERTFGRKLFAWLDGELPPAEAAEMEAHCVAHPEARARAESERAVDARIREALLAEPACREAVEQALARSRSADVADAPAPRGRILRLPRWIGAAAAGLFLAVAGMWFACLPPFECGVVLALEKAAEVAQGAECTDGEGCPLTARMRAAAGAVGVDLGNPARVPVGCCRDAVGTAYRVRWKGADVTCVWSPCRKCTPSFRRSRNLGGAPGWAAQSGGVGFVAFLDSGGNLCSLVGSCSDETLSGLASDLRAALH